MTIKPSLVFLTVLVASILGLDNHTFELAVRFFNLINTNNLLIATCSNAENFHYISKFNALGYQSGVLNENNLQEQLGVDEKIGIIIENQCRKSANILKLASVKKFYNNRKAWFVIIDKHINQSTLMEAFQYATPPMFNITEYFQMEYENVEHRKRLEVINNELNREILKQLKDENAVVNNTKPITDKSLKRLTEMEALPDSEVTLVVPSATGVGRDLYAIHRKTNHSPIEVEAIASLEDNYQGLEKLLVPTTIRRNNYNGAILRAACGLFYLNYFNRSDELTSVFLDNWAQMTFTHLKLIEESMNFRMLIKCFDDYGWPTNGVFNGVVGFMQRHHAEITATGLILRTDRMNVMDYVDGTFEFQLGLLFRQPNLASVTNIFILPFSRSVWFSLAALLLVTYLSIWWQLWLQRRVRKDLRPLATGEIFSFLSGVVSQQVLFAPNITVRPVAQGYYLSIDSLAVRLSILVVLISSLFLYTSYSATIVALLQAPAGFINSLQDFLNSPLAIGVEDLPYERKFLEEDDHEVVAEIYRKKVRPEGENAYVNTSEGIRRVRKGFYAFECELSNSYKLISETYTEREKCGLKKLDMFPNRILGPAITRNSPYKESLKCKMRWLREVGLTHRTVNRWSHRKPICEASRSGFSSVSINDIKPLILIFTYGILLATCLTLIERALHSGIKIKKPKIKKINVKPKPMWEYRN